MNYEQIKSLAKEEAQRLHDEWLYEHFAGNPLTEDQELGEEVTVDRIRKSLILGDLATDELEDALAYIGYSAMRIRTQSEWRNPNGILDSFVQGHAYSSPQITKSNPLSSYLDEYIADLKEGKESLNESSLEKYRIAISDFIEIVGDKVASDVDRADGKEFRSKLLLIPPHRNKAKAFKGKTIAELVAMDLPRDNCLSTDTISHRLMHTKRFFEWLKDTKQIIDNPLNNVSIESISQSYPPYTEEDLAMLFKSPVYDLAHLKCSSIGTRSRWWLMLMATYTGARIGELCQLSLEDVVTNDGHVCLSINDNDFKTLKTGAAKRLIPVHSVLLDLGFVEYTEGLKSIGEKRLLPSIPSATAAKKAGAAASDWYGQKYRSQFLPRFKEERKVFHSFRHTFIQVAMKSDLDLVKLQQMVGHESKLMGATMVYRGEGYPASLLVEQLKKVQFPSVDVEWLHKNNWRNIKKP